MADIVKTEDMGHNRKLRRIFARSRKRGNVLIEHALGWALVVLAVAAAMVIWSQADSSRNLTKATTEVGSVRQAVHTLFGGQPDYTGITNKTLTATSAMPKSMIAGDASAGSIRNAYGGAITVAPADAGGGSASGFSIAYTNIPKEACAKLVVQDMGKSMYSVSTGSATKDLTDASNPPPFTPAEAIAACTANQNVVTWVFN